MNTMTKSMLWLPKEISDEGYAQSVEKQPHTILITILKLNRVPNYVVRTRVEQVLMSLTGKL